MIQLSHIYIEQYLNSIIDLQTSFEIFIRNTHRLVLLKNGASSDEVEKVSSIAFRNVVEQYLAKLLDVELNFKLTGPVNDWYIKLYCVRNEIVHQGRIHFTGNEEYDAYVNARNYILDALVAKGYLGFNRTVDLNIFKKNTKGSIDTEL